MNCKECKWLKVNNYKFEDGTQTIECLKYGKILEFTDNQGEMPDENKFKQVIECIGDSKANLKDKRSKSIDRKKDIPQSGVKGISWYKPRKAWRVVIWLPTFKIKKHIAIEEDLEKAKEIYAKAIKNIDKYEQEERMRLKIYE